MSNRNVAKYNRTYLRQRRRRRIIVLVLILIVLFVGALGVRAYISLPYESVNLCDLAVIEWGGYNTAGTADIAMDEEAVNALLAKVKEDYKEATFHNTEPADEDYILFRQSLIYSLDKTSGLSNGSKVTMRCQYDKELAKRLKIEITGKEREITVSGLDTVTKLTADQLFEDLEVSFSGISPNLTISMQNTSEHPFIKNVAFTIVNPKEYYASGDMVEVVATYDEALTEQTNYIVEAEPGSCIKSYEAYSDSKYLTDASELPSSIIDEAIAAGKSAFKDANEYGVRIFCEAHLVPVYINKKATFVYGTPNFVSAYFKTVFPENAGNISYDYNDLDIIYSVVITQADGVACTAYAAVRFSNIILNSDGTYSYDFSAPKILSESYMSARVKKNVTDAYANTHDIEKVR